MIFNEQVFSALTSVCLLLYAKHLNNKPREGLDREEREALEANIRFFALFGSAVLLLSYL